MKNLVRANRFDDYIIYLLCRVAYLDPKNTCVELAQGGVINEAKYRIRK